VYLLIEKDYYRLKLTGAQPVVYLLENITKTI